jgi:LmbE family N-acetylglucosaminyl deacetylase
LAQLRWQEQIEAATQGQYAGVVGLAHTSSEIRHGFHPPLLQSLKNLLQKTQPQVIYTHNPFDGHGTHRAVFWHLLRALRESSMRPPQLLGVEVWRSLDWLSPQERVTLPIENPTQIAQLIGCHRSQLVEKNFVEATLARWQSHSTFLDTQKDQPVEHVCLALDLTELVRQPQIPLARYLEEKLQIFQRQIQEEHSGFLRSQS